VLVWTHIGCGVRVGGGRVCVFVLGMG
jgi:hypothetical protein